MECIITSDSLSIQVQQWCVFSIVHKIDIHVVCLTCQSLFSTLSLTIFS